jgi:hypothetical protein
VVSGLIDAAAVGLCLLVMTYTSAYMVGEVRLFEVEMRRWVSTQTLLCVNLLTQVAVARRAEYGHLRYSWTTVLGVSRRGWRCRLR